MSLGVALTKDNLLENALHLGKCWAAVRGDTVILTVSMRVPKDVDFEKFREKSIQMLELLGDVKTGDLYETQGDQYFLARPHKHQNRSKKKPPVEIKPLKLFKPNYE